MQNEQELMLKIGQLENSMAQLNRNNAEYQQLLERIPFAILITDFDHNLLFCNQSTYQLFGFEPLASNYDLLVNEIFAKNAFDWKIIHELVLGNQVSNFEIEIIGKDGGQISVSAYSRNVLFNDQNCIFTTLSDISGQKLLEEDLKIEQQKNSLIIDSIPAMIFIMDKNSRFIRVNKAFEEKTGFHGKEILGKTIFELIQDQSLASEPLKDDQEVLKTGYAKRNIIEPLFPTKNRWLLTDKIPFRNINGEITGILGFSTDISERKHAEENLLRSEKMFRSLFETAPDGIILSAFDGEILSTNSAIEDLLGYSAEEFKNLTLFDITPESWHKSKLALIEEVLQKGENTKSTEMEYIRKDKSIVPVLVTIWISFNEEGSPIQRGTYIKDISLAKKAVELEKSLLQKENEQLEKNLEAKTRELNLKITKLIEMSALVSGVVSKLEVVLSKDVKEKNKEIALIINELMNHANDDLWKQMELTFGQIHQSFYQKLFEMFPNLTRNEKRLCAFLKMNLSTKDISNITHQTIRSIEVARARLRIKMKFNRSDSLTKFFSQI